MLYDANKLVCYVALCYVINVQCAERTVCTTGAALLGNNEASAKLTTANGGTFTSSSARLSSQSRYSTLDQRLTCFNVIGYCLSETG